MNEQCKEACELIIAWFESEARGPDYGSLDRSTHPQGETIWKRWWDDQLELCRRTEEVARMGLGLPQK